MIPYANVDVFRKHYEDMISCRDTINTNADSLNSNEENAIEALIPIINEYGREMVKKLVVNAVLQNRQNYHEHIRKWADNAIISQFIFETDNVLSDYIPDHLSEAAIERIAEDIMDKEKNKVKIVSTEGTEYELIMYSKERGLVSTIDSNNMTVYCQYPSSPEFTKNRTDIRYSDNVFWGYTLHYREAYQTFLANAKMDERNEQVYNILNNQYLKFKNEMLAKNPEEVFDACYKIAAVEDVYFHLLENAALTEAQQDYILASEDNFLKNLAMDWYEYGDTSQELSDYISQYWEECELDDEGEEME